MTGTTPDLEHEHPDGWRPMTMTIDQQFGPSGTRVDRLVGTSWRYRCEARGCRAALVGQPGMTAEAIIAERPGFRPAP
jgi:hypothetical protein